MTIDPTSLIIKACSKGRRISDIIGQMIVDNMAVAALDLSAGAPETHYLLAATYNLRIKWVLFIYQEASDSETGVKLEVGYVALSGYATGRTADRNEFTEYTSEVDKAQWFTKEVAAADLLLDKLQEGEILSVYNPGGKTGTGAIWVVVGYERHTAAAQTPK